MMNYTVIQPWVWLSAALVIIALVAAYWSLRRRNMYRREFTRVFELHDLVMPSSSPGPYFRNFEQSLSEIRQKLKQFRDVEADLQGLDAEAWAFLKSEVAPLLKAKHPTRGWQFLFDKLNQAKAYNYLKGEGYPNVRFIPPSAVPGQQTPDLEADGVLCEVKTINVSDAEANRRHSGGVGSVADQLDEGFFRKLSSDLKKAKAQMVSYDGGVGSKHIVYIIANFDDSLHEYADRYQRQIDHYVAGDVVPGLQLVIFDVKPPFYTAMV
jgi:hypothetical protein